MYQDKSQVYDNASLQNRAVGNDGSKLSVIFNKAVARVVSDLCLNVNNCESRQLTKLHRSGRSLEWLMHPEQQQFGPKLRNQLGLRYFKSLLQ